MKQNSPIEEYFDIVIVQAASYYGEKSSYDIEDLIQIGFVGLMTAVKNHDSDRGPLRNYVNHCVRNHIRRFLSKQRGWDAIAKIPHADGVCNPEQETEKIERLLKEISHRLLPIESKIISLKSEGYTRKEVCSLLTLTKKEYYDLFFSAIGKIEKNAT